MGVCANVGLTIFKYFAVRNFKTMTLKSLYLFSICLSFTCCTTSEKKKDKQDGNQQSYAPDLFADTLTFPRIYVDENEKITLNGRICTIEEIDARLQEVKRKNGIVFYSTYNATANPPKEGPVINLIKKYQIGITMYSDKTFSKSLTE